MTLKGLCAFWLFQACTWDCNHVSHSCKLRIWICFLFVFFCGSCSGSFLQCGGSQMKQNLLIVSETNFYNNVVQHPFFCTDIFCKYKLKVILYDIYKILETNLSYQQGCYCHSMWVRDYLSCTYSHRNLFKIGKSTISVLPLGG